MRPIRWLLLGAALVSLAGAGWWWQFGRGASAPEPAAPEPVVGGEPAPSTAEAGAAASGTASPGASSPSDQVEVRIGKGSYEVDLDVPPYLALKKILEDELSKPERTAYDLFEIYVIVQEEPTRYLAVGPLFRNEIQAIPASIRAKFVPWRRAAYAGDVGPYRVYELK